MRRRLLKKITRRRFLLTLDNGEAFSAVVYDVDADFYELRSVRAVDRDGEAVPVDGTLIIERSRVLYAQEA